MSITERFEQIRQEGNLESQETHAKKLRMLEHQQQLGLNEDDSIRDCPQALEKFGIKEIFKEINNKSLNNKGKINFISETRDWYEDDSDGGPMHMVHYRLVESTLTLNFTNKYIPFSLNAKISRDLLRLKSPFEFEFRLSSEDGRDSIGRLHSFSKCGQEPIGFEIDTVCGNTHRLISPKKPDFPHTNLEIKPVLVNNEIKELCLEKIAKVCEPAVKAGYL